MLRIIIVYRVRPLYTDLFQSGLSLLLFLELVKDLAMVKDLLAEFDFKVFVTLLYFLLLE